MISQRAVTKRYLALADEVDESFTGKTNYYICSNPKNSHIIGTVDTHSGITPFMISCPICKCAAKSSMYSLPVGIDENDLPKTTHEWVRPSLSETIKLRKNSPDLLEHILSGGLILQEINKP